MGIERACRKQSCGLFLARRADDAFQLCTQHLTRLLSPQAQWHIIRCTQWVLSFDLSSLYRQFSIQPQNHTTYRTIFTTYLYLYHKATPICYNTDTVKRDANNGGGIMNKIRETINTVCKAVGLAMGVATTALLIMGEIITSSALMLLAIGVTALGLGMFTNKKV